MYIAKIQAHPKNPYEAHQIVMDYFYPKEYTDKEKPCPHFQVNGDCITIFLGDAKKPLSVKVNPDLSVGSRHQFSFRFNPTARNPITKKRYGYEKPEDVQAWLIRKFEKAGFTVEKAELFDEGKHHAGNKIWKSVYLMGILEITDSQKFKEVLYSGVGPAKGFGYGMLNIFE